MAPKQSAPPTLVFPPGIVVVVSVEPPEGEPGVVAVVVASVVVAPVVVASVVAAAVVVTGQALVIEYDV